MDVQHNILDVLHSADRPAFLVRGGVITEVNEAARQHMIPLGEPIAPLIVTGVEEYAALTEGLLGLSIRVGDEPYHAAVYCFGEDQIFTLELEEDDIRLQALCLAAVELRKPLSNILAVTDQLFPKLDAANERQLAQINRGLAQLQRIVGNMSGAAGCYRAALNLEVRDVDDVLREIFDQAAVLCEDAGVSLEYKGLTQRVYSLIDSDRLERCVYNVISNSLKHTPRGGSILACLSKRGNSLRLTIQDSGSGYTHCDPFGRFRREPRIGDEEGLGIGLRLVHACATLHGGTVLLSSSPVGGVKLTLSLPIRLDSTLLRSPRGHVDYAGERSHGLIELSESLSWELYKPNRK